MIMDAEEIIFDPADLTADDIGGALYGLTAKRCKLCERSDGLETYVEAERTRAALCPVCSSILRNQDRHTTPDLRQRKGDHHRIKGDHGHQRARVRGEIVNRLVDPFLAIDCEGGGVNEHGQQNLLLVTACGETGEPFQLFKDNQHLTTKDVLEFILSLPKNHIIVGYHFNYGVTMIL
jgi:hypothetical protein